MSISASSLRPPLLSLAKDGRLLLTCSYMEREVAKSVAGYKWDNDMKAWSYASRPETVDALKNAFPRLQVAQNVHEAVQEIREREATVRQVKVDGWENATPIEPMPIRTKPFQHQVLGFNIGLQIPAAALLMEQGCGKSLTAVAIAGRRYKRGEVYKLLITAPASVCPVWPKEFSDRADFPFQCLELNGPIEKRIVALKLFSEDKFTGCVLQIVVTNYEAVWRMDEALIAWKPDMIICDESQRIKTAGARQSKAMHRLAKVAKYRLILTGTPVTQNPLDFYSQYKFLDSSIFGTSQTAFRARYAVEQTFDTKTGGMYKKVLGYRNIDELVRKAHSIAFRVTKAECLDLPETLDQTLYCELEGQAKSIYGQLQKESVAELNGTDLVAANVLSKLLRLSQLTGGFVGDGETVHQVSQSKLSLFEETLNDLLEAGKKVVVFGRFIPEIEAIKSKLFEKKIPFQCITGAVPLQVRGVAVEQFQTKPEIKVFVAQLQCAGLGITLTAADTAIFYSLDFSFANYDQCRARIHRIGQKNACTYIHLVAKGTVDEKILAALQSKRDVATEVVDNWRKFFEKESV